WQSTRTERLRHAVLGNRGMMIAKFHPRGVVVVPVRWITCWEKTGSARGRPCCRESRRKSGSLSMPRRMRKKYTSGVLSFAEAELPPGQREQIMASFERVLMPGLDKDQYYILWVEHTTRGGWS
ncbi:hypothetical protein MWL51_26455, partial [Escherichia coli]|nr:hypothetical protein [Escherichia coli]